jgi:uncharacterized Ntn-hydrolase superfamily protein
MHGPGWRNTTTISGSAGNSVASQPWLTWTALREHSEGVVALLTAGDDGRDQRQLHVIDAKGRNAAHTGRDCIDWCGHRVAERVSVAGNMLAGAAVVDDTLSAYQAASDRPFADRLILAMEAGEAAGGDKRGRQSAALRIWDTEEYPLLDLRVDDHPAPLVELRRLFGVAHERFIPFSGAFATRARPAGIIDRAEIDVLVLAHQAERS